MSSLSPIESKPVALVTGGARRIGAEIVRTLHAANYRVVIHFSRSETEATKLAAELNSIEADSIKLVSADLLEFSSYQMLADQALKAFGRLDLLVNNASTFHPTALGEISEKAWDDLLGSNLKAPTFLSQALVPALKDSQGSIVNIVDIHARQPMAGHSVYCSAKAGLQMLTLSLAKELGPDIRVNGVAPGAILWADNESDPVQQAEIISRTALKRMGAPSDIAKAVLYLAGADYVTGHILDVDGGRTLGW
jgi:pteridine reductase